MWRIWVDTTFTPRNDSDTELTMDHSVNGSGTMGGGPGLMDQNNGSWVSGQWDHDQWVIEPWVIGHGLLVNGL